EAAGVTAVTGFGGADVVAGGPTVVQPTKTISENARIGPVYRAEARMERLSSELDPDLNPANTGPKHPVSGLGGPGTTGVSRRRSRAAGASRLPGDGHWGRRWGRASRSSSSRPG